MQKWYHFSLYTNLSKLKWLLRKLPDSIGSLHQKSREVSGKKFWFDHQHLFKISSFQQEFHYSFHPEGKWFSQAGKTFGTELLCKKNFPPNGQTRQAKSCAEPLFKLLVLAFSTIFTINFFVSYLRNEYLYNNSVIFLLSNFLYFSFSLVLRRMYMDHDLPKTLSQHSRTSLDVLLRNRSEYDTLHQFFLFDIFWRNRDVIDSQLS